MEKVSVSKGKKPTSADTDVTTSTPAPLVDVTTRPAITALTHEVQDLKAQLAKHGDTFGFIENVSFDLLSKFKILFLTAFTLHHIAVATPTPGNVATSTATTQPADSKPKVQG